MSAHERTRSGRVARWAVALGVAVAGINALCTTAPAAAAATPGAATGVPGSVATAAGPVVRHVSLGGDRAAQAAAVTRYWTPARMRAARLLDSTAKLGSTPPPTAALPNALGASTSHPATNATTNATAHAVGPKTATATAAFVPQALPPSEGYAGVGVSSTVGRVFFVDSSGATDACSGGSVTSEAGDMVWTAGHCVYGGAQFVNDGSVPRNWYGNWLYVPGYYVDASGAAHAPYGSYPAWGLATTSGWYYNADLTQDMGVALVVKNSSGQALTTAVGGNGLSWDPPVGDVVYSYGYPVNPANPAAPVGVQSCGAPIYRYGGTGPYGDIACSMGPGASGGPWLDGTDAWGMGYVVGINSQDFPTYGLMFSPWFSQNALGLYTALRNS